MLIDRPAGVMVRVLASTAEGFDPRSGQTKDIKIDIYCFSNKHIALGSYSKDYSTQS